MSITVEQIDAWRSVPSEHKGLEFKEAKSQFDSRKICRYCVAIANEGGGYLLLGIQDQRPRYIVGTSAINDIAGMAAKLFQLIGFRVEVEEVHHPAGRVVVFAIPSRPIGTAYHHEGAYLMRSGEELVPMSEDRLRSIFAEARQDWLSQSAMENCSARDVVELLDTKGYARLLKRQYPDDSIEVMNMLGKEKLIEQRGSRWVITNLAAILFAKRLDAFDHLGRKAPRLIVYEGNSKLESGHETVGGKGYALGFEGLIQSVNKRIPANEVIKQALRHEVKMFPEIAVRELVANALIHQDFNESGTSVFIEIYPDRMEISNPGPPFIEIDRFIDSSQSRNEQLANIMRRIGICEERGSGIDKVIFATESFQLPAPDFRSGVRRTSAILFAHKEFEDMDRNDRIRACYQHCCLRFIMNEQMTNQSLRERFKQHEKKSESISRIIRDTIEAGKVKPFDPAQTSTRYRRYVPFWG